MRIRRCVLSIATAVALLATAPLAASAATPIDSHFNVGADGKCPVYDNETRVCSGEVPSFDGAPLDVDLTMPKNGTGERRPLIVMLHGFGLNKHEWQSTTDEGDGADKYHWNSHWFAKQGYYVLTYTARGFDTGPPTAPYQPPTPSGTSKSAPNGTIRLKSREVEIRDTQYLSALVAAAYPDLDRDKVAVTGGSYGGGESWLQASQPTWSFPNELTKDDANPLPVLKLQVSVPKYGWTDLAYSLAPNGHGGGPTRQDTYESSQGAPGSPTGEGNPIGVVKKSWVESFFTIGNARGAFEQGQSTTQPNTEGPINIPAGKARLADQGDPYDEAGVEDAIVKQMRRALTEYRSAYYQDEGWASEEAPAPGDAGWRGQAREDRRKVAIFGIQGWTDDLFSAVEAFRQFKYLKRLDPHWPVTVGVADVGHSRAQNKPETWRRLNAQAYQWLQSHITGSHEQETNVFSEATTCENDGDPDNNVAAAAQLTASTPEGLSNGSLSVQYTRPGTTASALGGEDPDGPGTDPVAVDPPACRQSETPQSPGRYTAFSEPLKDASTYVGLGEVKVPYTLEGQTATFNARVWDVAPNGSTTLMTRGTYRIDVPAYDAPAGTLRLPLFGNQWHLGVGHKVRLDLTQVDQPFLRPATPGAASSSVQFGSPELKLPIRESADRVVPGA